MSAIDRLDERRRDPAERAEQERIEKLLSEQFQRDLTAVLRTDHGRRFVAHLLYELCLWGTDTYTGNPQGVYRQGRQKVAVTIVAALEEGTPEMHRLWLELQTERLTAKQRARLADKELKK